MIARVLIVVLAVLNLGAALWWGLHRPAAVDAATALPPGVARLQLWREVSAQAPMLPAEPEAEPETPAVAPASTASAKPAQAVPATADVQAKPDAPVQTRCYSYGPYPDRAVAQAAQQYEKDLAERDELIQQATRAAAAAGRLSARGFRSTLPTATVEGSTSD